MMNYLDQLGRIVEISAPPQRIVSLVPSQTELLYDLGLDERVVGITRFCVHPRTWFKQKKRVGGTKDFKLQRIHDLQPDLILANKEENTKEGLEELMQHYPVYVSDVNNLDMALNMIQDFGVMLDCGKQSTDIINRIQTEQQQYTSSIQTKHSCVYLIWKNPWMTIGGDTFINNMLEHAGFKNVFAKQTRYPSLSLDDIKASEATHLLLSTEPYPFKTEHVAELQQITGKQTLLVDGEMFSWYGSRLLYSWEYFRSFAVQRGKKH